MRESILSFARYEKKYLLSAAQHAGLWAELAPRLRPDEYFASTVCSLYYDDPDFSLIRASIEAPVYKEKLRLRSYGVPGLGEPVFVELKKKYRGMVYKRRVLLCEDAAMDWLAGAAPAPEDSQTAREIDWLLSRHRLLPAAYIACDRRAWVAAEQPELRITVDSAIRFRDTELRLSSGSGGRELLTEGRVLMEIKMPGSAPLWLAQLLSRHGVFPVGFSKYGECYREYLINKFVDGVIRC